MKEYRADVGGMRVFIRIIERHDDGTVSCTPVSEPHKGALWRLPCEAISSISKLQAAE